MRISPLDFHNSKVEVDHIYFIDEAYWIVTVIGFLLEEKAELVAY